MNRDGKFSPSTVSRSGPDLLGFRSVANTRCPALPQARAVAMPIPELVPVINTFAKIASLIRSMFALECRPYPQAKTFFTTLP